MDGSGRGGGEAKMVVEEGRRGGCQRISLLWQGVGANRGDTLEEELSEQEPPPKVDLDLDLYPDPDPEPEADLGMELDLKALLQSDMYPTAKPGAQQDVEPCDKDHEQQGYRIEPVNPYPEGLLMPQNITQWSLKSNSSYLSSMEEDQMSIKHHSICVQTSQHLFSANKLIQASEHSLQRSVNMQVNESSASKTSQPGQVSVPMDTLCSKQQLQTPNVHPALAATNSQPPANPCLSSPSLPKAIGLTELINFASSLALSSSSKMDLPNLRHMIKASPQKAMEPSTEPTMDTCTETLPEKPPEAGEPQRAWNQADKHFPCSYLDFSKPGVKSATIEGEVQLLQPPAISPQLQGAKEDSVPGTKKGNPLFLKIHFKVSSPTTPEK
ncbi:PREDICTED: spermatogenesis-associated protein 32 [Galeopterus variegatus]|uniref:Spermatogenesis-associated protein 32 n=1 Tax=Galeopterus variegatus TaxID=482537 RepID=A0ABM0RAY3_GALVR|nr:PREDICTED: spermatogenesis-associated protein 32 [Galeopterus variegatus]